MKRCLVIGPSWVGDMVMAQSLFKQLKADSPSLYLAVLAPNWSQALLARMPEVDENIILAVGHKQLHLGLRWRIAREIKARQFDHAIVLPGSLKSALIPFFAGISRRTGYVGEQRYGLLNDMRKLDKKVLPLSVQRFVSLASVQHRLPETLLKPDLAIDKGLQDQARDKFVLNYEKHLLALCPGAEFGPAKQWPAEHYGAVARRKQAQGWQVVLLGSKADKAICAKINALSGSSCRDLSGQTTLTEVIDVLSMADYVISNDSGLMHIAAALARPLLVVYGASSPEFTPPLSDNSAILCLDLSCQPCYKRHCPLGHTNCLSNLSPDIVLAQLTNN